MVKIPRYTIDSYHSNHCLNISLDLFNNFNPILITPHGLKVDSHLLKRNTLRRNSYIFYKSSTDKLEPHFPLVRVRRHVMARRLSPQWTPNWNKPEAFARNP